MVHEVSKRDSSRSLFPPKSELPIGALLAHTRNGRNKSETIAIRLAIWISFSKKVFISIRRGKRTGPATHRHPLILQRSVLMVVRFRSHTQLG